MIIEFNSDGSLKIPKSEFNSSKDSIAFKCNWNDNNYSGICSDEIYKYNKQFQGKWCSDPECECRKYKNKSLVDLSLYQIPCYECAIFIHYAYGPGVYRGKKKKGEPIPMKQTETGRLALLTTRKPNEPEENRFIFGFLDIKDIKKNYKTKETSQIFILGHKETSLMINPKIELKFWDYYKNLYTDKKHWGTGLFRYIKDKNVLKFLIKLKEEYYKYYKLGNSNKEIKHIEDLIGRYEKFIK